MSDKSLNVPIVIAHRGASAERPEHTLAAYQLALVEGADFIELDLVATADGVLIARHENALATVELDDHGEVRRDESGRPRILEATTDVALHDRFADRLTVKRVDGRLVGGWFAEDFLAGEIDGLRARERLPELRPASAVHDDRYGIPTLAKIIELVVAWSDRSGTRPGLYIELKHPTYYLHEGRRLDGRPIGTDLGAVLLERLMAAGFTDPERVFIQCFEVAALIDLGAGMRARGLGLPLIQLFGDVTDRSGAGPRDIVQRAATGTVDLYGPLAEHTPGGISARTTWADLSAPAALQAMAAMYATGIGARRDNVLSIANDPQRPGNLIAHPTSLLVHARAAGLEVHAWTLRAEPRFLFRVGERPVTLIEEAGLMLNAGVGGLITDHPAEGRLAVLEHLSRARQAGDGL